MGGPLAGHTARVQQRYLSLHPYPELVSIFRNGPPRGLSPFAIPGVDGAANTVEYFVHHEDVRRAAQGWAERELPDGLQEALWKRLKGANLFLFLRGAPTGIALVRGAGETPGDVILAGSGRRQVAVIGAPAELTLWSMGRARVANVEFDGPDEDVTKLTSWRP
jgi:uncharacterized protein (TIGR03085 family)